MPIPADQLGPSVRRDHLFAATGTTTEKLPNYGSISIVATSGAKTFTLKPPVPGTKVYIHSISSSTATLTVTSGSTAIAFNKAADNKLTFDAGDEAVLLCGLSATRWAIVSNQGSVGTGKVTT